MPYSPMNPQLAELQAKERIQAGELKRQAQQRKRDAKMSAGLDVGPGSWKRSVLLLLVLVGIFVLAGVLVLIGSLLFWHL